MNDGENQIGPRSSQSVRDISAEEVDEMRRRFQTGFGSREQAHLKWLVDEGFVVEIWRSFSERSHTEDMWVTVTEVDLDCKILFGRLNNEPLHLTRIKFGDVVCTSFHNIIKAEWYQPQDNLRGADSRTY